MQRLFDTEKRDPIMKNDLCCTESSCQSGKWFTAICAIVGFVGMATVLTLWLCKKYRKCTAVIYTVLYGKVHKSTTACRGCMHTAMHTRPMR